mgnify:CR=1 FL=1
MSPKILTRFVSVGLIPKEGLMTDTYSSQYREMVLIQVRAGRSMTSLRGWR